MLRTPHGENPATPELTGRLRRPAQTLRGGNRDDSYFSSRRQRAADRAGFRDRLGSAFLTLAACYPS